jgi:hypothetical protein
MTPASTLEPTVRDDTEDRLVKAAFARLDAVALGSAIGLLFGITLWVATVFLLLKGAPPGQHIGPHLGLLSNFLPLYSVSWTGSVVGGIEVAAIGFVIGALLAVAWNMAHYIWLMVIVRRSTEGLPL